MMGLIKELANSLTWFRIGVWYAQPLTVVLIKAMKRQV